MADDPIFSDVTINGKKEKFADPQHFTGEGNDGRAKTGENNPLPTKDGEVRSELESIKQTQTEILDKLNGTIDTKLTGSNVEDITNGIEDFNSKIENVSEGNSVKVKQSNSYVSIHNKLGSLPPGGSKYVEIDLSTEGIVNEVSVLGRNDKNLKIEMWLRHGYPISEVGWGQTVALEEKVYEESDATIINSEGRVKMKSKYIYIHVDNNSDEEGELTSLGVMLWN